MEQSSSTLADYLKTLPQYLMPHHLLSRLMFTVTRIGFPPWKNSLIKWFIRHYGVDMTSAEESDPTQYPDFNSFFTRALRAGVRPVAGDPAAIACPVDGAVSQAGDIKDRYLYQAKGREYSLSQLLAGDSRLVDMFIGGRFITLYLSPKDYHRTHLPLDGRLIKTVYVPGRLFAVNTPATRVVSSLFARNERLINLFETEAGPMALIMVGAIFVGSMETVWAGTVTPSSSRAIQTWCYEHENPGAIYFSKGAEIGRFNMGSTVIVLFGPASVCWSSELQARTEVKMGQGIGMVKRRVAIH
jgi:phosphatidylserine decarboxylase